MNKISCLNNFIEKCQCVYDVGSDHALLAISLFKNKKAKNVVNIEINNGPLQHGIDNLKKNKLLKYSQNIINDGLKNITTKTNLKPDYICIAGMGGNTIIEILKNKDKKLKNVKYVLQANCEFDILRKWLAKNKYKTLSEQTIIDKGKYYQILLINKSNKIQKLSLFEAYFGKEKLQKDLAIWLQHIKFTKHKIEVKKLDKYNPYFFKLYNQIEKRLKNEN